MRDGEANAIGRGSRMFASETSFQSSGAFLVSNFAILLFISSLLMRHFLFLMRNWNAEDCRNCVFNTSRPSSP